MTEPWTEAQIHRFYRRAFVGSVLALLLLLGLVLGGVL